MFMSPTEKVHHIRGPVPFFSGGLCLREGRPKLPRVWPRNPGLRRKIGWNLSTNFSAESGGKRWYRITNKKGPCLVIHKVFVWGWRLDEIPFLRLVSGIFGVGKFGNDQKKVSSRKVESGLASLWYPAMSWMLIPLLQVDLVPTSPATPCWPSIARICCICPPPMASIARETASKWGMLRQSEVWWTFLVFGWSLTAKSDIQFQHKMTSFFVQS